MRVRHILVEGPDGSGKTTLARHLEQHHGFTYHHEGPPKPEAYKDMQPHHGVWSLAEYYRSVVRDMQDRGRKGVFDRLAHSEVVYAPVLRPEKIGLDHIELSEFADWFRRRGGISVLCLPPYRICRERWLARANKGEELVEKDREMQFRAIYDAYDRLRRICDKPFDFVISGDWNSPSGFPCQVLCR